MIAVLDLKSFFDEAGTHANSDVVVLAGLLGPADEWAAVDKAISDELKIEKAEFYHATDVEALPRPRGIYKGWGRKRARAFTDRITEILAGAPKVVGLGVYVDAKDWLAAADLVTPFFSPVVSQNLIRAPGNAGAWGDGSFRGDEASALAWTGPDESWRDSALKRRLESPAATAIAT
jgi:hypothetical protein